MAKSVSPTINLFGNSNLFETPEVVEVPKEHLALLQPIDLSAYKLSPGAAAAGGEVDKLFSSMQSQLAAQTAQSQEYLNTQQKQIEANMEAVLRMQEERRKAEEEARKKAEEEAEKAKQELEKAIEEDPSALIRSDLNAVLNSEVYKNAGDKQKRDLLAEAANQYETKLTAQGLDSKYVKKLVDTFKINGERDVVEYINKSEKDDWDPVNDLIVPVKGAIDRSRASMHTKDARTIDQAIADLKAGKEVSGWAVDEILDRDPSLRKYLDVTSGVYGGITQGVGSKFKLKSGVASEFTTAANKTWGTAIDKAVALDKNAQEIDASRSADAQRHWKNYDYEAAKIDNAEKAGQISSFDSFLEHGKLFLSNPTVPLDKAAPSLIKAVGETVILDRTANAATAAGAAIGAGIGTFVAGVGAAPGAAFGAAVGRVAGTTVSLARKAMPFLASAVVSGKATEEEIINNARETISALDVNNKDDLKTLQAMPGWNEMLARSDNNPELAKLRMSAFASEDAAFAGAITGAIAGLVGPEAFLAKGATKLIVRSALSKPATFAATVGKTAGAAALSSASEGAEEAMTQYLSNYSSIYGSDDGRGLTSHLKATWGDAQLMEGVANAAAQGLGVGFIAGGAGGATGFRSDLANTEKAISQQRIKNEVNFIKDGVETLTNEVDTLLASGKVDQKVLTETLLSGFRTQIKELSTTANKYSYKDEQQGKQMVYDHIIEPVLEHSGITTEQATEVVRKISTAFPEVNTNPYAQADETPFIKALQADTLEQAEAIYGKPLSTLRADTWRVYNNKDTGSVTNLDQAQAAATLVRSVLSEGDVLTVQRAGAVLRTMYGYRNADNKLVDGIIHKHPNLSDSQLDAVLELAKTELDAYNRRETNEERQVREQGDQTRQQPNDGGVSPDGGDGSVAVGTPSQGQDQANQETNLGDLGGQEQGGQAATTAQGGGSGRTRQTAQSADASDVTAEASGSVAGTTETPPVVQDPNSTPTPRQPSATPTSDGGNGQANQAPELTGPTNTTAESTPTGSGVTGAKTAERSTNGKRTKATTQASFEQLKAAIQRLPKDDLVAVKEFAYLSFKESANLGSKNAVKLEHMATAMMNISMTDPEYRYDSVARVYLSPAAKRYKYDMSEVEALTLNILDLHGILMDSVSRGTDGKKSYLGDKQAEPVADANPVVNSFVRRPNHTRQVAYQSVHLDENGKLVKHTKYAYVPNERIKTADGRTLAEVRQAQQPREQVQQPLETAQLPAHLNDNTLDRTLNTAVGAEVTLRGADGIVVQRGSEYVFIAYDNDTQRVLGNTGTPRTLRDVGITSVRSRRATTNERVQRAINMAGREQSALWTAIYEAINQPSTDTVMTEEQVELLEQAIVEPHNTDELADAIDLLALSFNGDRDKAMDFLEQQLDHAEAMYEYVDNNDYDGAINHILGVASELEYKQLMDDYSAAIDLAYQTAEANSEVDLLQSAILEQIDSQISIHDRIGVLLAYVDNSPTEQPITRSPVVEQLRTNYTLTTDSADISKAIADLTTDPSTRKVKRLSAKSKTITDRQKALKQKIVSKSFSGKMSDRVSQYVDAHDMAVKLTIGSNTKIGALVKQGNSVVFVADDGTGLPVELPKPHSSTTFNTWNTANTSYKLEPALPLHLTHEFISHKVANYATQTDTPTTSPHTSETTSTQRGREESSQASDSGATKSEAVDNTATDTQAKKAKLSSKKTEPKAQPKPKSKRGTKNDEEATTGQQTTAPRTDDEASENEVRADKPSDDRPRTVRKQGASDDVQDQTTKSTAADEQQDTLPKSTRLKDENGNLGLSIAEILANRNVPQRAKYTVVPTIRGDVLLTTKQGNTYAYDHIGRVVGNISTERAHDYEGFPAMDAPEFRGSFAESAYNNKKARIVGASFVNDDYRGTGVGEKLYRFTELVFDTRLFPSSLMSQFSRATHRRLYGLDWATGVGVFFNPPDRAKEETPNDEHKLYTANPDEFMDADDFATAVYDPQELRPVPQEDIDNVINSLDADYTSVEQYRNDAAQAYILAMSGNDVHIINYDTASVDAVIPTGLNAPAHWREVSKALRYSKLYALFGIEQRTMDYIARHSTLEQELNEVAQNLAVKLSPADKATLDLASSILGTDQNTTIQQIAAEAAVPRSTVLSNIANRLPDNAGVTRRTFRNRLTALARTLWEQISKGATAIIAAVSLATALTLGTTIGVPTTAHAADIAGLTTQASQTVAHIIATNDNGGKPFIVADKKQGTISLLDASGDVLGTAPALYGSEVGDTLQGTNRQTPAGRFTLTYSKEDKSLGDMQVLDGVSMQDGNTNYVWAIHRVINPKGENRLNRLTSKTASDNRISNGCINVPAEFFNKYLDKQFDGVLYVLPETANFNGTMFNNTTVSDRANITEQSGRSETSTGTTSGEKSNATTTGSTTPTAEQVGNIGKHPLLTADEITAANNRILGLPDEAPTPADEPARVGDNPSTQQAVIEAVTIDGKSYTTALVEQGQLTPAEERADTTFDTLPTTEKSSDGFSVSDIAIALGSLVGLGAGIVRLRRVRRNGKVEVEPVLDDTEATADTETVTETPTEPKSTTDKLKSLVSRKKQPAKSNRRVVENDQDLVSQIRGELLSLENLQDNIAAQQLLYAMAGNPSALAIGYAANWNPIMRSINAALQDDTNAFKANSKTFSWRIDRKGTDDESKANGPISSLYNRYVAFAGGATPNFDRFLELTGGKRIGLMQDSFKLSAALAKINATRNALFGTFNTRVIKDIEKTMLDHEFNPEYAKRIKALGKKPSQGDIGYSIPHDFGMYATYMHAYYEAYDWQIKSMTNVAKHHETEAEYARDKALEVVRKYVDDDQVIDAITDLIESNDKDGELEAGLRSYDISHNDLNRVKRFKRDFRASMTKADRQYELINNTQEYYENTKDVTGKTDYALPIGMTKQDIEAKMKALEDLYGKDALEKTAKSIFRANELAVQEAVMRGGYTSQELATIKAAGFKMYVPLHKAKSETDATVGDVLETGYFDVYEESSREYRTMGLTPDLVRYHRKGMTSPPNDAYTNLLPFVQNQMGRAAESDFKHGIRELAEGTNPTIDSLSAWKKDGAIEYTDTEGLIRIPASASTNVLPEYLRNHVGVRMRGTTVVEVPHETERGKFVKKLVESDYIYYFTDIKVQNELTHVAQSNDKLRRSIVTNNLYTIQRWQAALMTSKRPVWNLWNFFKEASERTITMMFRPVADADGNRISSRKLAATNIKNLAKISASMELQAEITDYIRYREVVTPLQRILAEMDDAGALQLYTSTVDRHNAMQDEFKSELDKFAESVGKNAKKLASKYKVSNRALSNTESLADWYQTRLVETPQVVNALATYMTYKQLGVNKKEATNRTRDMFDPLRLNAPAINKLASFFPFVRSALAGNYNTARTVDMITQDPKLVAIAVLGVMSSVALLALALSALGDDDETGEPYAERLKFDDLSRGLPIRVGKDVFFVPMGFGAPNILWSMGAGMALGTMNEVEPSEVVSNTLMMALKNTVPFSPASGDANLSLAGVLLSIAPAMVRPVAEVMFNQRAFGGSAIVTARNVPEGYDKADVSAWGTPEAYKTMAKTLAGVGLDMHPEQLRHLIQSYALQGPLRAIDAALQDKGEKSGGVLTDKGETLGPLMTALGADINYQTNRFSYRNAFYDLQEKEKEILKKYGVTATRSGADTLDEITEFAGLDGLDSSRIKQEDSNIARVRNELIKKGATLDEVQFIIDMNYAKLDYREATAEAGKAATHYYRSVKSGEASDKTAPSIFQEQFLMAELEMNQFVKKYLRLLSED